MKLFLLSDLQLMIENPVARLDSARDALVGKLTEIFVAAKEEEAVVLQAGDFFDKPRGWFLLPFWFKFFKDLDVPIYTVFGQHDTYLYHEETREATCLGILEKAGLVTILGSEVVYSVGIEGDNVAFWGCSYGSEVPEPSEEFDDFLKVLVIHKMIVPWKLWSSQEDAIYAPKFLQQHKAFDLILCGDCHRKFIFRSPKRRRIICNTGCLIRHEATEYNFEYAPGYFAYNTEDGKIEWREVTHKKASEVLSREHIEDKAEVKRMLDEFIGAVTEDADYGTGFFENLVIVMQNKKVTKGVKRILSETVDEEIK